MSFLGGVPVRHHHFRDHRVNEQHLAEFVNLVTLDQQAKATRAQSQRLSVQTEQVQRLKEEDARQHEKDWLGSVMAWWPESDVVTGRGWREEVYD
jgi:uncharacterized protein YgbK (DUF1537 family)